MPRIFIHLAAGALFILIKLIFWRNNLKTILTLFYMIFASYYDIKFKRLPFILIITFSIIFLIFQSLIAKEQLNIIAFIPGLVMLLIFLFMPNSLGLGDALVIISLGILISLQEIICVIFFSLFFVCITGVIIFAKNRNKKQALPFIPFMLFAFLFTKFILKG